MKTITMPGISRPVSAVCLGTADMTDIETASPLYDRFVEAGGNVFDTAWIYGLGRAEQVFGEWLERRRNREEIILIVKGAHTPRCTPEAISAQLNESFERLNTGFAEVYMMHRDDPAVPVGEFVDVITQECVRGRVRSYGFSNWSLDRLDAAIAYAKSKGLPLPTALSNNFSLAEMVEPVWAGCVQSSDSMSKKRLARGDVGLFAWSGQARGFFVRTDNDPELKRCWGSELNNERKKRANKLAAELSVHANDIALAYCLHQAFPIVPLIGPLSPVELQHSLNALRVELTEEQIRWLEA